MEQKAIIVSGSPYLWLPNDLSGFMIGADRGAKKIIDLGYKPDIAIGDFDSVSVEEMEIISQHSKKVITLPKEKDETDTEAAIDYGVSLGYRSFDLYGATGGRIDHQYVLIALTLRYAKRGVELSLSDEQNKLYVLTPGRHRLVVAKKYLSFFALEEMVKNLTLEQVKYPLFHFDLALDNALCVSNEVIGEAALVEFTAGYLLVIESSDFSN